METRNCRIASTSLGLMDRDIMTFWVMLKFNGGGQGLGGFALDGYDRDTKQRSIGFGAGIIAIRRILEAVGVERWEDLKGTLCRARFDEIGSSRPPIIGHVIEDKWFDLKEFMAIESVKVRKD